MSLADFQTQIDDLVRDKDQVIAVAQRDSALATAVLRYSDDRPNAVVADAIGDDSQQLALPAGWESGFSQLQRVEYPLDMNPRAFVDMAHVALYQTPADLVIELPVVVGAAESARLTYTQRHVVDVANDTVPVSDRFAVCCWAASILCGQLANYYASDSEPTIQADSVDHRRKSDVYRARERELAAHYFKSLGIDEKRSGAAGVVVNLQGTDSRGNDRLFHKRRYR